MSRYTSLQNTRDCVNCEVNKKDIRVYERILKKNEKVEK